MAGDAFYVVGHAGIHYGWLVREGHAQVFVLPDEQATRHFVRGRLAQALLTVPESSRVMGVTVLEPGGSRLLYDAAVLDGRIVEGDGKRFLLAEHIGLKAEEHYCLTGFDDVEMAAGAFSDRCEQVADEVERGRISDYPDIVAAHLRHQAARARGQVTRLALGMAVRRASDQMRAHRQISSVAHAIGVSREFLHRVLTGTEWALPGLSEVQGKSGGGEDDA
ncbi:hypothetical protein [Actinomadura macrotermitis]|uniref:hypothetical protein n=1 Tax=Actinomadura macrotermitis TaxID=2585200 RepID=UPI00129503E0|nr:hypothetical protein [Actinomadura macrotermitis]